MDKLTFMRAGRQLLRAIRPNTYGLLGVWLLPLFSLKWKINTNQKKRIRMGQYTSCLPNYSNEWAPRLFGGLTPILAYRNKYKRKRLFADSECCTFPLPKQHAFKLLLIELGIPSQDVAIGRSLTWLIPTIFPRPKPPTPQAMD